jgi:DNA-directed RNA polymerase specialized sigma24 family protein
MPVRCVTNTAEASCLSCEQVDIMKDLLMSLSAMERESLRRCYVLGHDDQRICRELRIPAEEFRSLRFRVKSRFREHCR